MNRAENSDSIPIDLILEIFSRLPSKSVGRFHCVSKLWQSMLSCPYFKELYLTRSSTRPRLLFVVHSVGEEEEEEDKLHFYSSSQPPIPYDKSSLVVAADYHTTFPSERCSYASGLICFRGKGCSGEEAMTLICNPITGQYAELPKVIMYIPSTAFLGFDPIDKQFKILLEHLTYSSATNRHLILTLGVPKLGWRSDNCYPKYYGCLSEGICISGVIYYLVRARYSKGVLEIVCFDVRYEEFKVIEAQCFYNHHQTLRLINYKGKLGGITGNLNDSGAIELRMWVLHDVGKQEWSEYVYTLPENDDIKLHDFTVAGMTTRGEFVLSMIDTFKPFYVFYFNPEKNALRSVEIQGFGEDVSSVEVFVDHVEDFNFLRRESSYGDIYYVAHEKNILVVVCFDVRYEEFKVIEAECFNHKTPTLINYKGKLGGINWESGDSGAIELRMWVLHDVGKKEWSKYVYPLPQNDVIKLQEFTVAGMTTRGEFVLFLLDTFKRFYVFYFNAEKNTLRSVEIQGFGENVSSVKVFVDHVEDFNFF
uniref:F-box domain-containing protein n=2 Tax=Brassica campestris TaxID=3711 RepID=A0A3P5ZB58_BRACM|nr:unnamed protein product [Brassica rapa]